MYLFLVRMVISVVDDWDFFTGIFWAEKSRIVVFACLEQHERKVSENKIHVFFCLTGCFWYHFSLRIQDCATLCRSNLIHKLKVVLKKLRFKLFASSYYHGNTFCIHVDVFNFPLSIFAFVCISYGKKLTIFLLIRQQGRRDYWMACDVRLKQDTLFWMETFHKSYGISFKYGGNFKDWQLSNEFTRHSHQHVYFTF